MKTIIKKSILMLLTLSMCISLISCGVKGTKEDLWQNATYTEDMIFGGGSKTLTVKVTAEEKSVTFTVNTDKTTLGDALLEYDLISGEQGPYGLYVKTVNGIYADYNTTKGYWSVNKNGEYMMTGVDLEKVEDGNTYEFIYTKN